MVDKSWTHIGVEHAQGSDTTHLYLAATGTVGHKSEIREGMIWRWGDGKSLFWDSSSKLFWRKCPVGMTYHLKEEKMS